MSDRRAWLEEWCPECRAAPGARCRHTKWSRSGKWLATPLTFMHCARGWRQRACPTCRSQPEEPCRTPTGRGASRPHAARLRPGRHELLRPRDVWEALERRGASVALVEFWGRAGQGGQTGRITLCRPEGDQLVDVERWSTGRDELTFALEAPVWERYGTFAGHPRICGTVTWIAAERCVVLEGDCGGERFEETIA